MNTETQSPGLGARLRTLASGHGSPLSIRLYTLGYVLAVTALFAGTVALLHAGLESTRKANEEASRQETLLRMLKLIEPGESLTGKELRDRFSSSVLVTTLTDQKMTGPDGTSQPYTYYGLHDNDSLKVIPIWGSGFWGFMAGYAAVDESSGELRSVEFTHHEETPGLGGRIGDKDVKARFAGVTYLKPDSRGRRIRLVPEGTAAGKPGAVDAITGATGTSQGVEKILNQALGQFLAIRKDRQ